MSLGIDDLRRMSVSQTLVPPAPLARALDDLGFVQADPIRAPARAQDLILRHRVTGYRAGDLERRYAALGVSEDFFINYGFVSHALQALMHPRPDVTVPAQGVRRWPRGKVERARRILDFVRERGAVHPKHVEEHFGHGTVKNYWGGSSNATTQLLDALHYRGLLRVVRRDAGIRVYAAHDHPRSDLGPDERRARLDALVDAVVRIHAPLPAPSLPFYLRRLRYAVPQWQREITAAIRRARERLAHASVGGREWYWLEGAPATEPDARVYLLAPFDPVVHDRTRFELLWGWTYRFEAYTPVAKRKLGYYAMPLLFRDWVLGWANAAVTDGLLDVKVGFVAGRPPRDRGFRSALDEEIERMRAFLGAE